MDTLRQMAGSLLLAFISAALVIGGISLAFAESYVPEVPTPTQTLRPQVPVFNTATASPLPPVGSPTFTQVILPTSTLPPPTNCPPPIGWVAISIQPGDNLASLAARYRTTTTALIQANCLYSNELPTGHILFVPPFPTPTVIPCGPPPGWIRYVVQPQDNLYRLSLAYGVSVAQLQQANCLPYYQTAISAGQLLWVPNVPTRTPLASPTKTATPIIIIFPTLTFPPTSTFVPTGTSIPTSTPTATVTRTSTSTSVPSPTIPSPTTPPTATPTITAFPTQTNAQQP